MKDREAMMTEFMEQKERMRREKALTSQLESVLQANRRLNAILIVSACLTVLSSVCSVIVAVKALLSALL